MTTSEGRPELPGNCPGQRPRQKPSPAVFNNNRESAVDRPSRAPESVDVQWNGRGLVPVVAARLTYFSFASRVSGHRFKGVAGFVCGLALMEPVRQNGAFGAFGLSKGRVQPVLSSESCRMNAIPLVYALSASGIKVTGLMTDLHLPILKFTELNAVAFGLQSAPNGAA